MPRGVLGIVKMPSDAFGSKGCPVANRAPIIRQRYAQPVPSTLVLQLSLAQSGLPWHQRKIATYYKYTML
jgi:hypothetical protein